VVPEVADLGRFSEPALLILASLADRPKHGYGIEKDVRQFSGVQLEPGTLYGALARMESRGWIEPLPAEDRRRPYRLTGLGAAVLRARLESVQKVAVVGLRRLAGT
jgi:DNA-binding PadR family transcriptional regulator